MTHPAAVRSGSVAELPAILATWGVSTVMWVIDEHALEASGAAATLERAPGGPRFTGFAVNPTIEDVRRGVDVFSGARPDAIVAFGGGSAIDLAKAIGTCAANDGDPFAYVSGERTVQRDGPPLLVVPTTAGTGSEATHFAVVYASGVKYSLAHEFVRPDDVILDPQLTWSLPPNMTAATGLDALCQGIESLWAVGATAASTDLAARAVTLALTHLADAVTRPTPTARAGMMEAAHLAGRAIDVSKTTAPHALSYGISSGFGVPHGAAVAVTLGAFIEFNAAVDDASCTDSRGAAHVRSRLQHVVDLLGASDASDARRRFEDLVREVGWSTSLAQLGVPTATLAPLAAGVNLERLGNNPRVVASDALRTLLLSCM